MATKLQVREFIVTRLKKIASRKRKSFSDEDGFDILGSGLVDSMGFLELVTAVEDHFKLEIDFTQLKPGVFTTLGGLVHQCSQAKKK